MSPDCVSQYKCIFTACIIPFIFAFNWVTDTKKKYCGYWSVCVLFCFFLARSQYCNSMFAWLPITLSPCCRSLNPYFHLQGFIINLHTVHKNCLQNHCLITASKKVRILSFQTASMLNYCLSCGSILLPLDGSVL